MFNKKWETTTATSPVATLSVVTACGWLWLYLTPSVTADIWAQSKQETTRLTKNTMMALFQLKCPKEYGQIDLLQGDKINLFII